MNLNIKDKFNKELPADPDNSNTRRQVHNACFSYVTPRKPSMPKLLHYSEEMAANIGLDSQDVKSSDFLKVFSGNEVMENTKPYAMCYGGHQFGQWAGQLGDGRAINLAEVEHNDKSWSLQLKGAGATPYSRTADGFAVLRSSIREHLCSEAMYHLGVPTTRSLSLMLSGDQVMRDMMYDGNADYEKGAIVCRAAESFIRFGNFEILASRGELETLKKLADYTIKNHFSDIQQEDKSKYLDFFREVTNRTQEMIVHWQRVGFVHGVMNTDNMSILGLTIDFGPYGWLEGYEENWTPNTTDRQMRRYRFGHQPSVALWNLVRLANAIYPLVEESKGFEEILNQYQVNYQQAYADMMMSKLGLENKENLKKDLIPNLIEVLQLSETDMTIFFRKLAAFTKEGNSKNEEIDFLALIKDAFYNPEEIKDEVYLKWQNWFESYRQHLQLESLTDNQRKTKMNAVNPKYVLRNYMAQLAIDAADNGDYSVINELHTLLKKPYQEQLENEKWFVKRPEWARHKVGCSMLSCSS